MGLGACGDRAAAVRPLTGAENGSEAARPRKENGRWFFSGELTKEQGEVGENKGRHWGAL